MSAELNLIKYNVWKNLGEKVYFFCVIGRIMLPHPCPKDIHVIIPTICE